MFEHFLEAQTGAYSRALSELQKGQKQSHWMWFVFPQIRGLGNSPMSMRFALEGVDDARRYLSHPVLGARLRAVTQAVLDHRGAKSANDIFGYPDDLKFRSCMTLFAHAAPSDPLFTQAIEAFYKGREDPETVRRL